MAKGLGTLYWSCEGMAAQHQSWHYVRCLHLSCLSLEATPKAYTPWVQSYASAQPMMMYHGHMICATGWHAAASKLFVRQLLISNELKH